MRVYSAGSAFTFLNAKPFDHYGARALVSSTRTSLTHCAGTSSTLTGDGGRGEVDRSGGGWEPGRGGRAGAGGWGGGGVEARGAGPSPRSQQWSSRKGLPGSARLIAVSRLISRTAMLQ